MIITFYIIIRKRETRTATYAQKKDSRTLIRDQRSRDYRRVVALRLFGRRLVNTFGFGDGGESFDVEALVVGVARHGVDLKAL